MLTKAEDEAARIRIARGELRRVIDDIEQAKWLEELQDHDVVRTLKQIYFLIGGPKL